MKTSVKLLTCLLTLVLLCSVTVFGAFAAETTDPRPTITLDGAATEWGSVANLATNTTYRLSVTNDDDYIYALLVIPFNMENQDLWKIYLLLNLDPENYPAGKSEKADSVPYVEARIGAAGDKADVWPMTTSKSYDDKVGMGYNADNIKTTTDKTNNLWTLECRFPLPDAIKATLAHSASMNIKVGALARYSTGKTNDSKYDLSVTEGFNWNNGVVSTTMTNPNPQSGLPTFTVTWDVNGVTSEETYEQGETPSYKGEIADFEKNNFRYSFKGWDSELSPVIADVTYTATWSRKKIETATTTAPESTTSAPETGTTAVTEAGGSDTAEPTGGCGSSFGGTEIVFVAALLGLCLIPMRKKQQNG